ncbi:MAG: hypothetical protein KJ607_03050 [Bacteroidetes bacterium]|nr:hypothetical protein [Bacteroidota bacterium]
MKSINQILSLAVFLSLFLLSACSPKSEDKDNKTADFEWLTGEWIYSEDESVMTESWKKVSDSLYCGKAILTEFNDTVFSEELTISGSGESIILSVVVPGQNDGKKVEFRLTSSEKGIYVFENQQHDFPNKIIYKNPEPGILHGQISGNSGGREQKQDFIFVRK